MCHGVYSPPSPNNPQLPNCQSQYLGSTSDFLHPVCLRGRPDRATLDLWRNVLPHKRLLHADFPGRVAYVRNSHQREQIFFNRTAKRKCDIFQPAPDKNYTFHLVVLGCFHRCSTEFRVGSLWVFRLASDLFHSRGEQLFVH